MTNEQEAQMVAEKIRIACEQFYFPEQQGLNFTNSFGVCCKKESHGLDELIHNADYALYEAKARGRNRVCVFSETAKNDDYET